MRDYAELIEALRNCTSVERCDVCGYASEIVHPTCYEQAMIEAADAIEELLAESAELRESLDLEKECYQKLYEDYTDLLAAVPKWISVEERLPDLYRVVLVVTDHPVDYLHGYGFSARKQDGEWFSNGSKILFWMPLPEPPKEVE